MTKQVIKYRTCDRCSGDVDAAVTDKIMFNGSKFDIDLCEKHSLELFSAMMRWLDLGTKTGDTGRWDQQREAKPVTINVDVKPTLAAANAVVVDAHSTPVTPLRPLPQSVRCWPSRAGRSPTDMRPVRTNRLGPRENER